MTLSLRIALRYLLAKKSHNAVNIISLVSMAGIAVAAMAMICVMSVFNGFTQLASSRLSAIDPEVKITPVKGKVIANADSLADVIGAMPGVAAAMPTLTEQALAISHDRQLPVTIHGIPGDYDEVSDIGETVIDGEILEPDHRAVYTTLSVGLAIALEARPGYSSIVRVMTPRRQGHWNPALPLSMFRSDTLTVSGVYQTDQAEYDTDRLLLPLSHARRLLDYTTEATAIEVATDTDADPAETISEIRRALGNDYTVADRMQQQETSFRMIRIEKWVTFLMLTLILIMAAFNILSTMSMLIIEKQAGITILSSLGAPLSTLRAIFLKQGFLIAITGGAIGLIAGIILVLLQQHFGFISLGGDHSQMSIQSYPVALSGTDILAVAAIIAVTGLVAGLISASRVRLR